MKLRKEFDSIGVVNVPNDKYWGASTQRSNKFFNIGKILVNISIIKSIAIIKRSAAIVHTKDKLLDPNFIYKGTIDLRPFFLEASGNLKDLDSNELLDPNSTLVQFLKTETLNNKNLNMNISINAKQISYFKDLINLKLKSKVSEGFVDINETMLSWSDNIDFKISDSLLYMKNNNLVLDALITMQINDYDELYKFFQTPRNYRKEIETIEFNLNYNFDQFTANLTNIKIDEIFDKEINKTLKQLNLKENRLQNRIYFKNLMNQAIKLYAG